MKTKIIFIFLILLNLTAESDLNFFGFLDTYYAKDDNNFPNNKRYYFTQPVYEDSLNINLAHVGVDYKNNKIKGRFVLQSGNSVDANYSSEKNENFRFLQEGYIGYLIADKISIDTGIFLSHIGLESFISRDNFNLTRSFVAEFSPYYQSGIRISHEFNNQISGQLHLLNGWQNISTEKHPAIGTQLKFTSSEKLTYIYNTFLGKEDGVTRFFNDFIINYKPLHSLDLGLQYDLGIQEVENNTLSWNGVALVSRYQFFNKTSLGARIEKYSDPSQIIVSSLDSRPFKAYAYSVNIDQKIIDSLVWRNEIRKIYAKEATFIADRNTSNDELLLITSLQYSLN